MQAPALPEEAGSNGEAGSSPALSRNCNPFVSLVDTMGSQVDRPYGVATSRVETGKVALFQHKPHLSECRMIAFWEGVFFTPIQLQRKGAKTQRNVCSVHWCGEPSKNNLVVFLCASAL